MTDRESRLLSTSEHPFIHSFSYPTSMSCLGSAVVEWLALLFQIKKGLGSSVHVLPVWVFSSYYSSTESHGEKQTCFVVNW